ncbi:sesquipedalian-1-like [Mugil cephalus]|uniref:sesquipedalian-1-like n=1 Tax=Mugil cephalus TaxID=48193 RepID=UPI001FB7B611|nr:sesquipedalian-1-like [Mugil cephalus]
MKIHEKIVTYFESCNSPVDKEGYLYKKGEIKTSYQKRWFVLKGNLLFYKDRPTDRDVIGVIVLEGCTVQLCESEEQFAFSLVWSEQGLRTYKFAAEDEATQENWIKALLSANHSYLALLVLEMEKKYRDALASSGEPAKTFTMPNFNTSEVDYASSAYPAGRSSTLSSYPPGAGSGVLLPNPAASSSKGASRKSPKLWPKRSANTLPVGAPALACEDWSGLSFSAAEDFCKIHEDYGKEVKELIAEWARRGRGGDVVPEENLIDFG